LPLSSGGRPATLRGLPGRPDRFFQSVGQRCRCAPALEHSNYEHQSNHCQSYVLPVAVGIEEQGMPRAQFLEQRGKQRYQGEQQTGLLNPLKTLRTSPRGAQSEPVERSGEATISSSKINGIN
jgi:hypothetical protein